MQLSVFKTLTDIYRRQLHSSRISAMTARGLNKHALLIGKLSPQYMSGDETDSENLQRRTRGHPGFFRIVDCAYRSAQFTEFLRTCDKLYRDDWADPRYRSRRATPGNPPRMRLDRRGHPDHKVVDISPPRGLPRNCYDPTWLSGLRQHVVEALEIQEVDYDFHIPPDQLHGHAMDEEQQVQSRHQSRQRRTQVLKPRKKARLSTSVERLSKLAFGEASDDELTPMEE